MIATTTQLNKPGIARGAKATLQIDWARVPLLPGVRELAARGEVAAGPARMQLR